MSRADAATDPAGTAGRTAPPPPVPPVGPPGARRDGALLAAWAMAAAWALAFSLLSVARHRAFWTGRFDLGNMVQAVWSTSEGRPLETTDVLGRQFVRLGAHVDPLLVLLAPLWRVWPDPALLLVTQAVAVALGAVPVFLLGRLWLGDDRLALAGAAAYLLYPPLQWSTVSEFHPVTLATPLLLTAIWAVAEGRPVVLAFAAVGAALGKEQVGLALAGLGLWAAVAHGRRRWGAVLAVGGIAWTAVCIAVVMPHFRPEGGPSPFLGRYAWLGDTEGEVLRTVVTRPWTAFGVLDDPDRLTYLAALLLPLLLLPLAAPLLAAAALPELGLNLLADYWPQYAIEFQYTAVITPFLVAAALRGLARLRARAPRSGPLGAARGVRPVAVALIAAPLVAGWHMGPLPLWDRLPGGSGHRTWEFDVTPHARVMAEAAALIPDDAAVSVGNPFGAHLSARARVLSFPLVADAEWVIADRQRPYFADRVAPADDHRRVLAAVQGDRAFRTVFDRDGVVVLRRVRPGEERP